MALRTLRYEQDPVLRKISKPVSKIGGNIITLLDDMIETMAKFNGVGLAAPQVGVLRRIVIIDVGEGVMEFINPEIIEAEGEQLDSEACLSLPGRSGKVQRPMRVKVKALNRNGEEFVLEGTELLAVAICHEIDHLNGILYTDRVIEMYDDEDYDEDYEEL